MILNGMGSRALTALTAVALTATACSSSGGDGSVSVSQIQNKLKKDPAMSQLIAPLKGDKTKISKVETCIAKAMKKYVDKKDLKAYVDGKKNLPDLGGNSKGSAAKANEYTRSCATAAVSG
jgi:hypothetical protein